MATLPEEWKSKAGRARKKVGTFQGKKRPGGPAQSPPPKKKPQVGLSLSRSELQFFSLFSPVGLLGW